MKKIKVYIVTYKKDDVLNKNLQTLWENTNNPSGIEVTVLSNYPQCTIYDENKRDNLRLIFNTTRMPHAWGYLSRDWNFCILDAFKNWTNPENIDWCVLAQNDVTWVKDWDVWLENNTKYDFISQPVGDQCIALNTVAVKKVGFFDERLTTLHYQEADYFIRAIGILNERCSINDGQDVSSHYHNPLDEVLTYKTASSYNEDETLHNGKNFSQSYNFIKSKYSGLHPHTAPIHELLKSKSFGEINWYPFFWDGYDYIKSTFIQEYNDQGIIDNTHINYLEQTETSEIVESKDISVVVQGSVDLQETQKCLNSVRKNLPEAEIILSTWQDSKTESLDYDVLVLSSDPGGVSMEPLGTEVTNNINRQIISTLKGIKKATRKYILKIRTNACVASLGFLKYYNDPVFHSLKREQGYSIFNKRIMIDSCFTRDPFAKNHRFCFHPSDLWFFGLKEDLENLFDIPLQEKFIVTIDGRKFLYRTPEQYIWTACLEKNGFSFFMDSDLYNTPLLAMISTKSILSNFIVLDHNLCGISFPAKFGAMPRDTFKNIVNTARYFEMYRNIYDNNYEIPKRFKYGSNIKQHFLKNFKTKLRKIQREIYKALPYFLVYKKINRLNEGIMRNTYEI